MQRLTSLLIWAAIILLIIAWLPLLALIRLFDRSEERYQTGRWFRKLGLAISRVNPNWNVALEGHESIDDRNPYVVVGNHLSNADIPLISNLPWEMKWVAKRELFKLPLVGTLMKLAGDIPVDRSTTAQKVSTFKKCVWYLDRSCSVMFFPEGTRSRDGRVRSFSRGAFDLAIREKIPILPLVVDGTQGCLPKNSWVFQPDVYVKLKVLDPVPTDQYEPADSEKLAGEVRDRIISQLMEWRGLPREEVDGVL
ncbi:MAG: lysophospholipid acyltransferase family protein [Balneolaceae bacterium]